MASRVIDSTFLIPVMNEELTPETSFNALDKLFGFAVVSRAKRPFSNNISCRGPHGYVYGSGVDRRRHNKACQTVRRGRECQTRSWRS